MGKRATGRRLAMQVLFQLEGKKSGCEGIFADWLSEQPASELAKDFAGRLAYGAWNNLAEIDGLISRFTVGWSLERLSKMDRAILRLATYELLYEKDLPAAVVINEALELARKFSGESSVSFINGILDSIYRQIGRVEKKVPPASKVGRAGKKAAPAGKTKKAGKKSGENNSKD